jgi:cytochrome P450
MTELIRGLRAMFGNRLKVLEEVGAGVREIARIRFGPRSVILVNSPDLIREVLIDRVDDFHKGPGLRVVSRPLLGNGLLTSEGAEHDRQRRLVAPAFAHQRVHKYGLIMERYARRALAEWPDEFDMAQAMMRLTLGIVGQTLFGEDLLDSADSIGADVTTVQRHGARQLRLPFRLPRSRKASRALDRLNARVYGMIRERRASGEDRGDLLAMLLLSRDEATGQSLTDQQVRDEAMTLFIAGHETTAQALAWSWYLLARNPEMYERLQNEGATFALLVIKEAMRLYPPAWAFSRSAIRDTVIGGFPVRDGEMVVVAPWLLHRDQRFFAEPLRFHPDRFLAEADWPKFAYFPFGGGRRICIGNQFALMESQIVLSTIAPEVSMTALRDVEPLALLLLRPKGGIPVRIERSDFLANRRVLIQGAEI